MHVALLVATALLTTACGGAEPTLAADPGPQEPFPQKGESLVGVRQWLKRNTTLASESFVSVGDRYAAAMIKSDYGGPWIRSVQVHIEVLAEDFGVRLGGRSAKLTADIDCSGRLTRPKEMTVYPGSDLKGLGQTLKFPSRWIAAGQGAYLDDVVAAACDANFHRPFEAGAQVASISNPPELLKPSLTETVASPEIMPVAPPPPGAGGPTPAPAQADVSLRPATAPPPAALPPAAAARPAAAPAPAPPAAPVRVATAPPVATPPPAAKPAPAAPAPPIRVATAPPAPAPAPVKPAPPAPAPPPVKVATAPPPAAKPAPAPAAPASSGGFAVQVGALATTAAADQVWAELSSKPPVRGRARKVEPVSANGKTLYRLMVAGFIDRGAAQAFCLQYKQTGKDCLVRAE